MQKCNFKILKKLKFISCLQALNNSKCIIQNHFQFFSLPYFAYDLLYLQVLHDTKDKNHFSVTISIHISNMRYILKVMNINQK